MRMRGRVATALTLASATALIGTTTAGAQTDGLGRSQTQHRLTPAGETEVNYYSGGSLTQSTRIPSGSAFNTTGRGSGGGGAAQPCFAPFTWSTEEPNANAMTDPETGGLIYALSGLPTTPTLQVEVSQASTAWIFTEMS